MRAWILLSVFAAAPAWCDEARTVPAPGRASFDLTHPEIRKALRKTVATQTGQYVLGPAKDAEPEPPTVKFVPPEKPVERHVEYPTSLPSAEPLSGGLLSAIVNGVINDVLLGGDDHEHDYRERQDQRVACTARGDDLGSTTCDRSDATKAHQ